MTSQLHVGEGISLNDGDGEKLEYIFDDDEKNMIAELLRLVQLVVGDDIEKAGEKEFVVGDKLQKLSGLVD